MAYNRLRGNSYIPKAKAERVIIDLSYALKSSESAFHQLELENKLNEFVTDYRSRNKRSKQYLVSVNEAHPTIKELHLAKEAGIFNDSTSTSVMPTQALDVFVAKTMRHNNWANQSSGHQYGVSRDRKHPRKKGRKTTGFNFRPEIPSQSRANGQVSYVDSDYEHLDEQYMMDKYAPRKNHRAQSMPKVDWSIKKVRKWVNAQKRRRTANYRQTVQQNKAPKKDRNRSYIIRHGTIPNIYGRDSPKVGSIEWRKLIDRSSFKGVLTNLTRKERINIGNQAVYAR